MNSAASQSESHCNCGAPHIQPIADGNLSTAGSNIERLNGLFHQLYAEDALFLSVPVIDSHCHLQLIMQQHPSKEDISIDDYRTVISPVVSRATSIANVSHIVVNGVSPLQHDWAMIQKLYDLFPTVIIPNFGLHPWWINEYMQKSQAEPPLGSENHFEHLQEKLTELFSNFPTAGLGECGLDKPYTVKYPQISLDLQASLLQKQLDIAGQFHRSVTLHCVQAWGRLAQELSEFCRNSHTDSLPKTFILHSCNACPVDMVPVFMNLPVPVYFSVSGRQLYQKQVALLTQLPCDRVLVETDAPDQLPPTLQASNSNELGGGIFYNEPAVARYVLQSIFSLLKSESLSNNPPKGTKWKTLGDIVHEESFTNELLANLTTANAKRAFGIDDT